MRFLLDMFEKHMIVDRDSVIDDHSRLLRNQQLADSEMENNFPCTIGFALFELLHI